MDMTAQITDKQLEVFKFAVSNYDCLICDGAIRSGKTCMITSAFIAWAMNNFHGKIFAICGKTVGSAIKNIISPFLSLHYTKKYYKTTFSRHIRYITLL